MKTILKTKDLTPKFGFAPFSTSILINSVLFREIEWKSRTFGQKRKYIKK